MSDPANSTITKNIPNGESSCREIAYGNLEQMFVELSGTPVVLLDKGGKLRNDTITLGEVKVSSKAILETLFAAWDQLRSIITQDEDIIIKRWLKKTAKERRAILLQAWEEMPRIHRPDFEAFRKGRLSNGSNAKLATEIALKFPHINLEDLSRPRPLLLMLDSRSRNFPSVFAKADQDSIRVGTRARMLVPGYMQGYAMYLDGEETRQTYGRLASWVEDRKSILASLHGFVPDPGLGLMILEVQRDILQFLLRCSAAILRIPIEALKVQPVECVPDPSNTLNTLTTVPISITDQASEAPYQAPYDYNFHRLKNLVYAKFREVDDHSLLIREDPGYFAEVMYEQVGHTEEALFNREHGPTYTNLSARSWDDSLRRVLSSAYDDYFMWGLVLYLFDQSMSVYSKHITHMQPDQDLPDDFVKASHRIGLLLDSFILGYLRELPAYMSAVPTFKKQITRRMHANGKYDLHIRKNPDDYLFWLFTQLVNGAKDAEQICGLPSVLQELEALINRDQQQKKRLTSTMVRFVSDLTVLTEMQRHFGLATCNEWSLSVWSKQEGTGWLKAHLQPLYKIRGVLIEDTGLASLVSNLRVFDYPSSKPRTALNTARMRSAEQALDTLWESINQHAKCKIGMTLKELEKGIIVDHKIRRTPPWEEPQCMEKEDNNRLADGLNVSLALATLEERTESTIGQAQPSTARQKAKTRGPAPDNLQDRSPEPKPERPGETPQTEPPKLTVKKKAFNTFAALFGKPLADKLPGELPWTDFKKAMVNVGFGAEKLQGSGWLFESDRRSIIFHEPHPESKLPMQWARRIARRLNRNFGWTAESFVLEDGTGNDNGCLAAS